MMKRLNLSHSLQSWVEITHFYPKRIQKTFCVLLTAKIIYNALNALFCVQKWSINIQKLFPNKKKNFLIQIINKELLEIILKLTTAY